MTRFIDPVPQLTDAVGEVASYGKLYFYENGDLDTAKDTYSDVALSTKNINPIVLPPSGRVPDIFGEGLYSVVFEVNGIEQWIRHDVSWTGSGGTTSSSFAEWSTLLTYAINAIVRGSDGNYYNSIGSGNKGNDPVSSEANWEQINFLTFYNPNVTYNLNENVFSDGILYKSKTNGNVGNTPESNRTQWEASSQPEFSVFNSSFSYSVNSIVRFGDVYYRSITDGNSNNTPDTSPASWAEIVLLEAWSSSVTYTASRTVVRLGDLYTSLVGTVNNPPESSPTQWRNLSNSVSSDGVGNDSGVAGANASEALDTLEAAIDAEQVAGAATDVTVAALSATVSALDTDDIANDSGVTGVSVTAALDKLAADVVLAGGGLTAVTTSDLTYTNDDLDDNQGVNLFADIILDGNDKIYAIEGYILIADCENSGFKIQIADFGAFGFGIDYTIVTNLYSSGATPDAAVVHDHPGNDFGVPAANMGFPGSEVQVEAGVCIMGTCNTVGGATDDVIVRVTVRENIPEAVNDAFTVKLGSWIRFTPLN